MSNIRKILIEEIRRAASKEIYAARKPLIQTISALKKQLSEQNRRLHVLEKLVPIPKPAVFAMPEESAESGHPLRITGKRVKALRIRLGISQSEFASLLGVSISSVNNWESGKIVPRKEQKLRIACLRDTKKRELKKILAEKGIALRPAAKKGKSAAKAVPQAKQVKGSEQEKQQPVSESPAAESAAPATEQKFQAKRLNNTPHNRRTK